jgi:dienelactone hydrolase
MGDAGIDYTFKSYEGAKHSFTNPMADSLGPKFNLPLEYNEAADQQSWQDMKEFFNRIFAD